MYGRLQDPDVVPFDWVTPDGCWHEDLHERRTRGAACTLISIAPGCVSILLWKGHAGPNLMRFIHSEDAHHTDGAVLLPSVNDHQRGFMLLGQRVLRSRVCPKSATILYCELSWIVNFESAYGGRSNRSCYSRNLCFL